MENENTVSEKKFCPNCGRALDYAGRCAPCEFSHLAQNQEVTQSTGSKNGTIVIFVLSILNVVIVAPTVLMFSGLWAIFGAFAKNETEYVGILLICFAYFVVSLYALIASSIKMAKKK